MKKILSMILVLMLALSMMSFASASEAVYAVFVETTGGTVEGYNYNGVDTFFAIQYGTAERFQEATAYSWDGVRVCNVMGEIAPQTTEDTASRDLFNSFGYNLLQTESEENCLQLNVWSPDVDSEEALPVVVWIHGGGYTTGSSTQFNFYFGDSFASSQNCVFVSINHRLNSLGFLDVSAYGGEEYANSANVGLTDIILALQWVQDNIANFGGDASNVTIIGQSGGAGKVTALMSMPSAQGLFQKAVALSGGSVEITRTTEDSQADAAAVVEVLGLSDASDEEILETLTTISYEELMSACNEAGISYGPTVDGDLIPDGTWEISSDVTLIAANVLGEFSTNYAAVVAYVASEDVYNALQIDDMTDEEIEAMYIATYGEEYGTAIMEAFLEAYPGHSAAEGLYINFRRGDNSSFSALPLVEAMESYGGTAYISVQAYSYPMYGTTVAIHTASDIPFWFNNIDDIPEFVAGDEENAQAVAEAMSNALGAFAWTGDPSTDTLTWEPYSSETGATMVFDSNDEVTSTLRYNHDEELFELIDAALAAQAETEAE